jgi:hypothetical protein
LRFTSVGSGLGGDMVSREVTENGDNGDEMERGSCGTMEAVVAEHEIERRIRDTKERYL